MSLPNLVNLTPHTHENHPIKVYRPLALFIIIIIKKTRETIKGFLAFFKASTK